MFKEFTFHSLTLSVSFFGLSLPVVELFLYGVNLFLILANVAFGLLYLLFIRLVMVDLGVQVELFPFQISDKAILLINKLIESFDFLCEHDNLMFEILDLDFNSSVLIECLFQLGNFSLVGLYFVVVVSQQVIESFDLFVE